MKFNLCHKDEGCNKIHNIRIRGTIARPDDPMGKIGVEPTLGGEKGVSWIMDVQWDFFKKYILIRFWVLYFFFFLPGSHCYGFSEMGWEAKDLAFRQVSEKEENPCAHWKKLNLYITSTII